MAVLAHSEIPAAAEAAGAASVPAIDDQRRTGPEYQARQPRDRHSHGRSGHARKQARNLESRHRYRATRRVLRLEELLHQGQAHAQPSADHGEQTAAGDDLVSVTCLNLAPAAPVVKVQGHLFGQPAALSRAKPAAWAS